MVLWDFKGSFGGFSKVILELLWDSLRYFMILMDIFGILKDPFEDF